VSQAAQPGIEDVVKRLRAYQPEADLDLVRRAHEYAARAHEGQNRISGGPYIAHPLAVADLAATLRLDAASICAALLHDVREDAPDRSADLEQRFGREIATIVEGVTKLDTFRFTSRLESQAENFKKMLVAMSRDIRVLLVKLCDRLHNMRDLEVLAPARRKEIAEETLSIYSPLAERLGISWIRTELEDLAFRNLWPEEHATLKERAEQRLKERAGFIREVVDTIRGILERSGMTGFEVFGRPKNLYGIFRKMRAQGIDLDKVYDFVAFRVIVREVVDCWIVLGHLHNLWTPIPSRFKDYINVPKPNGYRSLHTSVFGPRNEPMEIQIRTAEMHRVAESGIAAHWTYKEGGGVQMRDQDRFNWLKQLIEWAQEVPNPHQFLETVQGSLFTDQVFAFTPAGDLKVLPKGATPLDFAYDIHTEIGHRCTGARVNNRLVPLSTPLRSGDLVEIMTSKTGRPKRDWLSFVATARAKNKIRQFFQAEEKTHAIEIGRQVLEKELRRRGFSLRRVFDGGEIQGRVLEATHTADTDELFRAVATEKVRPSEVCEVVAPGAVPAPAPEPETKEAGRIREFFRHRSDGIAVDGVEDMLLHLAKCCSPIPGDDIVAFVTRGRGVTVHAAACDTVRGADPDRLLRAHWTRGQQGVYDVPIQVTCLDEAGVLARVTKEIGDRKANISSISTRPLGDRRTLVRIVLQVEDQGRLDSILKALRRAKGVVGVERLRQAPAGV
jgi:GTP pyrophosphokinase